MRKQPTKRATRRRVAALAGAGILAVGAIAWAAAPANDSFVAATELTGAHASVTGTNVDATVEANEPNSDFYMATVWYSWTAPAAGKYRLRFAPAAGSDPYFVPRLNVFAGASIDALQHVEVGETLDDDGGALQVAAGARVLLQVSSTERYVYDPATQSFVRRLLTGSFSLALDEIPAPPNDDFADALLLTGDTFATGGVTEAATLEPGEPQHDVQVANAYSVWYRWTAAASGRVLVAAELPTAVYTGSAVNALTLVARTDEYGEDDSAGLAFDAVAGTTYSIALDGGRDYRESEFTLRSYVRPGNDDRANASVVSGVQAFLTGSTALSTHETGEPADFLTRLEGQAGAGEPTPGSVWYSWTAPVTGRVRLAGHERGYVAAFTGPAAGPLTRVDERVQPDEFEDAETFVNVTAGTRYLIGIDSEGTGEYALRIAYAGANDAFDDAIDLAGPVVSTSGSNLGATLELGEPHLAGQYGGSVWWDWVAPSAGDVIVSTAGSDFDTVLAVYTGTSVRTLDRVAENDDAGDSATSRVGFPARAGVVYHLCVSGATRGYYDPDDGNRYSAEATGVVRLSIRPGSSSLSVTLAAAPSAVKVDEAVVFTANAPGSSEFRWDFGDGKSATTLSGEATHSYDAAGTFHVTVTAVDGADQAVANLDVAVAQDLPCVVNAFGAALNFKKPNSDSVTLSGSIALPSNVSLAGQTLDIDVGGIRRSFTLDAKGAAKFGNDSLKVTAKPGQNAKFVVRLTKGSFQADLADEGLENADASGEPVLVDVSLEMGGMPFDTTVQAFWTAKQGKAGVAK